MSVGQLRLYDGTILPLRHDDPPVKLGRAHISVTGKPALAVGRYDLPIYCWRKCGFPADLPLLVDMAGCSVKCNSKPQRSCKPASPAWAPSAPR